MSRFGGTGPLEAAVLSIAADGYHFDIGDIEIEGLQTVSRALMVMDHNTHYVC